MARHERLDVTNLVSEEVSAKTLKLGGDPFNGTDATAITATAAEINSGLDGLTATAAELNAVADGVLAGATITLGTASAGSQAAAIQLTDAAGTALAHSAVVMAFMSDNATGLDLTASAPTTVAGGTDGDLIAITANTSFFLQSEADGDIDVTVSSASSGAGWYLVIVLPNGKQVVSDEIIPTPAS